MAVCIYNLTTKGGILMELLVLFFLENVKNKVFYR